MKAIVLRAFGGPETLRFEEIATPAPAPEEALIRVRNVSVNVTLDILLRRGVYPRRPALPHVMGTDPVGEIVALGAEAKGLALGDRVGVHTSLHSDLCVPGRESRDPGPFGLVGITCWGGYAEYAAVRAANCFVLPDGLGYPEATAIVRHMPTARHLLHKQAALQPGEWVLVMGATGGLGSCCVQVAKRMGARVIAAAGADERVAAACELFGADHGVNYRSRDLAADVMDLTDGHGADVVTESIGDPDLWPGAMGSLAVLGRLVTAGAHAGGQVGLDLRQLYLKRQRIIAMPACDFDDIDWALAAAGERAVRAPIIDRILPLHLAADAHRLIEARQVVGKILLDPVLSAEAAVEP